jgi:N-acetylneuraminate synthase
MTMDPYLEIAGRRIGRAHPTYIVAELSANHNQDIAEALRLIDVAAEAGADAVKFQTYTPDTLTIDCDNEHFRIKGTLWEGKTLYRLYAEAFTPWEWHAQLAAKARDVGLQWFSTPFDETAVDFLVGLDAPAYKVASFECVDIGLLRKIAQTGRPIIMSTGMATLAEIDEAVTTLRDAGAQQLALLKCTSAYPAPPEDMNLATIPHLAQAFGVVAGLSDHTLGGSVPVVAVALGARIVEKHLTMSRQAPGPDSAFSLEPAEFKAMVSAIRIAEQALGTVHYGVSPRERESRAFRRSLFVVQDIRKGEPFTNENVRSIRPGNGLHTRHLSEVVGRTASRDIPRGTPLAWDLVGP